MAFQRKRMRSVPGPASAALALLFVAGCAGSGIGLDANGRPLGSGGGSTAPLTADFNSIQDHVFTPICSVCHAGGSAPQGLRLDAANSYTLLVGVPSTEVPAIERVKPDDPNNSYLIQKLEGHASVGAQMPFGGPPLSADTIAAIRQWITDGAQRPVAAAAASVMQLASVTPAPGEVLAAPPPQVAVAFTSEIDATPVNRGALRIERVMSTNGAESVEVLHAAVAMPSGNPQALLLTPAATLASGHYRVLWSGEPGVAITDIGGHLLQGVERTPAGELLITSFDVEAQP